MPQKPNRNEEDLKRVIAALLATEGRSEDEVRTFQAKAAKLMHKLGLTRGEARHAHGGDANHPL